MEHQFQSVDILDETGKVIGHKQRRELDKRVDIYHAVYILLITPEHKMALSIIPAREDLPNLYANQYGSTMATIRRSGETSAHAAARGVAHELFMEDVGLTFIGEGMEKIEDGRSTFMSFFTLHSDVPESYSLLDIERIELFNRQEFKTLLEHDAKQIAPTLRLLWKKYGNELPV